MKGLSDDQQEIIRTAAETAKEYARDQSDARIASRIKTIEDSGTEILTPDETLREQMEEAAEPVEENIAKHVDADLVKAYLSQKS